MGFNDPSLPRQDGIWEIQVAVLLSFLLRLLLIFLGPTRRRSSAIWSRFTLWSCFLLADSVTVLTLGLVLFSSNSSNREGRWWLHKIAEKMHVDDFFIHRVPLSKQDGDDSSPHVLKFIFDGLKPAAEELKGKEDIMEMCNYRGKRVIQRHATKVNKAMGVVEEKFKVILDSVVQSDLDESLLMWHITTDLCRYRAKDVIVPAAAGDAGGETASVRPVGTLSQKTMEMQAIGETLSEYMLYLLIKQPDMLAVTAGIGLLRYLDTCEEARRFFDSMAAWIDDPDDTRRMLLSVNTVGEAVGGEGRPEQVGAVRPEQVGAVRRGHPGQTS